MSADRLACIDELTARQLVARREQVDRCIASGQAGLVPMYIYTLRGMVKLERENCENISERVLGILKDDRRGFEVVEERKRDERKSYLVVDCSGPEGFEALSSVTNSMAALLYREHGLEDERKWPGTWIPTVIPSTIPESASKEETEKIKARLSYQVFELLRTDPGRVEPLLFSGESK